MRNIKKLFIIPVFVAFAIVVFIAHGCFIAISPSVGIRITDSPPDLSVVKHFYIGIKGIEIQQKQSGVWMPLLTTPVSTDLVSLIGEAPKLLVDSTPVEEGDYRALKIEFTPTATIIYKTTSGSDNATLSISATTLSFDRYINQYTEFILDFDLGRSVSEGSGPSFEWVMNKPPMIHLFYGDEVGTITGKVVRSSTSTSYSTSTYLVLRDGAEVISTSYANKQVSSTASTTTYSFSMTAPFGSYTLEFYTFSNSGNKIFATSVPVTLSNTNPNVPLKKPIDLTEY